MAIRPIIILHGYSDSSKSFVHKDYAKSDWLRAHGLEVGTSNSATTSQ